MSYDLGRAIGAKVENPAIIRIANQGPDFFWPMNSPDCPVAINEDTNR